MSDDNAFVESLFRTAKYRPEFPANSGFKDLQAGRQWASATSVLRSAMRSRTGRSWRRGMWYRHARQANPKRWSGKTRDWSPIGAITLNPERECVAAAVDAAAAEISAVVA